MTRSATPAGRGSFPADAAIPRMPPHGPARPGASPPNAENAMASLLVKQFSDGTWNDEVLKSDVPVVVDFWAVWCGPCRAIAPSIDQIASEYEGRVKVGKLDVDHNQQTAMNYRVSSIPTVLVFKGGKIAGQVVGAVPKAKLVQMVEDALKA